MEGKVGFEMPWWAYLAAAVLVAAGIVWVALTLGLSVTAWLFLVLAITILAVITDFDINHYSFHSTYANDGSTFRFMITHENSLPQFDAEIDLGEVHLEEQFSILTTIVNPVAGLLFTFVPEWININLDEPVSVNDLFFTGFRLSSTSRTIPLETGSCPFRATMKRQGVTVQTSVPPVMRCVAIGVRQRTTAGRSLLSRLTTSNTLIMKCSWLAISACPPNFMIWRK